MKRYFISPWIFNGKEDGKMEKRKNNKKYIGKMSVGLLLLCLTCSFLCGCSGKKEKPVPTATPTPLPTPVTELSNRFADADGKLVSERAAAYKNQIAVTLDDIAVTMDKAMYLIYSMEVRGNYYAAYYNNPEGTNYWDTLYDDTRTVREAFKQETMDALIQYGVLYDCAVKNGMSLTEEEIEQNNAFVEQIKEVLTAEETERGGFTTEGLREVCGWMMLAEKYYNKMTDNLDVDKEEVRATINKEEYKEYETQYLYLATAYYDDNFNICQESDDVKAAHMAKMQDYYEQVMEGVTFEVLQNADSSLKVNTRTFLEQGDGAEEAYRQAAKALETGEISAPVQTEYGIYLIRMVDPDCTKSYEAAVDAAYESERQKAFVAAYKVLREQYEIAVNEEVWGDIVFGSTVSLME